MYRAIQGSLYKKKYELVPRYPVEMIQFDADESCCKLKSGENIVKGDTVLENGKRILMFSVNDLLDVAARSK